MLLWVILRLMEAPGAISFFTAIFRRWGNRKRKITKGAIARERGKKKQKIRIKGAHFFINPPINCHYYATRPLPALGIIKHQVGYCENMIRGGLGLVFEENGPICDNPMKGFKFSDFWPMDLDNQMKESNNAI